MSSAKPIAPGHDKPLFTPGPLTTSLSVKLAMLRDLGSRDGDFIACVRRVRDGLLQVAGTSVQEGYEAVLIQGSGTFGIESVLSSVVPPRGRIVVAVNGAYGERMVAIAQRHQIETIVVPFAEDQVVDVAAVRQQLVKYQDVALLCVVHCETTSGVMNPIQPLGELAQEFRVPYFVDSMSAFGAVEFDFRACHIDYLVSSANKCIEGVPGFSFAICRRSHLLTTRGWSRSVSLDLLAQWEGLEKSGQFRFTPPTHTILAFEQALRELSDEGGVAGRAARYRANYDLLRAGMRELGFQEYLPVERQGYIITSFRFPTHPAFVFEQFYDRLNARGYVIYPGKVSNADCFRIGNIGRLFAADVQGLLLAIRAVLQEMQVEI